MAVAASATQAASAAASQAYAAAAHLTQSASSTTVQGVIQNLASSAPDDFNKIIVPVVTLVGVIATFLATLFVAPFVQLRIARKTIQAQTEISKTQVANQEAIARRQVEMQEQVAAAQVEMQQAIANNQVEIQRQIAANQVETQRAIAHRQAADNISAKRQVWIDELRDDVSRYIALLAESLRLQTAITAREASNVPNEEERKKENEIRLEAHQTVVRIALRLNPDKLQHQLLQNELIGYEAFLNELRPGMTEQELGLLVYRFQNARNKLVKVLQALLRTEWLRIKNGDI